MLKYLTARTLLEMYQAIVTNIKLSGTNLVNLWTAPHPTPPKQKWKRKRRTKSNKILILHNLSIVRINSLYKSYSKSVVQVFQRIYIMISIETDYWNRPQCAAWVPICPTVDSFWCCFKALLPPLSCELTLKIDTLSKKSSELLFYTLYGTLCVCDLWAKAWRPVAPH